MSQTTIAQPWARALLDLAVARNELARVRASMDALVLLLKGSADLRNVVANPVITISERKAILRELGTGEGWSTTVQNFILLLADRRRLPYIAAIAREFGRLADQYQGIVRAHVRTASLLSEDQARALSAALARLTGRTVQLSTQVDPSVVGGLRIQVDGKVYDTTVRAQLDGLRQSIMKELH